MRIIILGGSGLIGHKLWQLLPSRFDEVYTTLRRPKQEFAKFGLYNSSKVIGNVDILDFDKLEGILQAVDPDVIINCIGITKRKELIQDPFHAISVNSLYPHKLAQWVRRHQRRMIHFSTDCVFNGAEGNYTEDSLTTAEDTYGRTKALGEVRYPNTLTIRSSFIGRELEGKTELLEWFLAQRGPKVRGFTQAYYSGVSTIFMTRVVGDIIQNHPELSGLYQLATPEPIAKYDLLTIANRAFNKNVELVPDDSFVNINTLNGDRLRAILGYSAPSWEQMLSELAQETIYS